MQLQDLIEEAQTLQDLLGEHVENLMALANEEPADLDLRHPVAAGAVGSANSAHQYEIRDLLPAGRRKHSPALPKKSDEENRTEALAILAKQTSWMVPMCWAEQHHADPAVRRYYRGMLLNQFRKLEQDGLVERRATNVRGANYEFRLVAS